MIPSDINIVTAGSNFEGTVEFDVYTRFDGYLKGTLKGTGDCELILGPNGVVEGKIEGVIVIIDGFVRGDVKASNKIVISETGKVIGELSAPNVAVKFGGFFDGKCSTDVASQSPESSTKTRPDHALEK